MVETKVEIFEHLCILLNSL